MKKRRVYFSVWGRKTNDLPIAQYAVADKFTADSEAVAASIARTTGLSWCGGPHPDGISLPSGERHYHGTLGESLHTGGWCPRAEVWFSIDGGGKCAD